MFIPQLTCFYTRIKEDHRISTAHISLYMAFVERWSHNNFEGPVSFKRKEIMETAKISGVATYHRCLKDLASYGYLHYVPSFNPMACSQVFFL